MMSNMKVYVMANGMNHNSIKNDLCHDDPKETFSFLLDCANPAPGRQCIV